MHPRKCPFTPGFPQALTKGAFTLGILHEPTEGPFALGFTQALTKGAFTQGFIHAPAEGPFTLLLHICSLGFSDCFVTIVIR